MTPAIVNIKRKWFTERSTVGELIFDDFRCFSLEDTIRKGPKIYGETAIPSGRYEIILSYSDKFGKLLPLLLNVRGFEGVRIHSGNRPEDTQGCVLVGKTYDVKIPNIVSDSRVAFKELFGRIQKEMNRSKIILEIS